MHFEPNEIYHIYNRGNNKIRIFFTDSNYIYFLKKIRNELLPFCDLLCYCLMPNHFHLLISVKTEGCEYIQLAGKETNMQKLSKAIGKLLSSYSQAVNIQNNTSGTLFQKKTKAKNLSDHSLIDQHFTSQEYIINCFHYIHNNPMEANLVDKLRDWAYSSWPDYYSYRNGTLINKELAMQKTGLTQLDFQNETFITAAPAIIKHIW